ncbi:MAG: hypothetical protein HY692_01975 [Cyanobacteria bacterium NC_groundwater_1444_Ag_S-0.65um_54_12]|nr:hypothetical protein [Cyanobacteria bacterium NC_groundwater_1444_Ag_S-0.65um_54_12]
MTKENPKKVGILVGWEDTFPPAFIEAVNKKSEGDVTATFAQIGVTKHEDTLAYDVIVDRISQDIELYKPWLKQQALNGAYVINDPFWWLADDKFFDNALVAKLGVAVPRTVILPSYQRNPNTSEKSHRNLQLMDWEEIFNYLNFPMFLKPYTGGGWKKVYKVRSAEEFFYCYAQTGQTVMVLQEAIDFDSYVRCLCIGKDNIMPIKYDPHNRQYLIDHKHLTPELGEKIVRDARVICHALNYDMNSIEFAIRDGVPVAIDFLNPAPDMDYYSITPFYFDWVVEAMSTFVVELARRTPASSTGYYPWKRLLETGGELAASSSVPKAAAKKAKVQV